MQITATVRILEKQWRDLQGYCHNSDGVDPYIVHFLHDGALNDVNRVIDAAVITLL